MIDITSKRFKTIVEATTNGILSEMEAVNLLDTTPANYRQAVDEYFLILEGKAPVKTSRKKEVVSIDSDILAVEYQELVSNEIIKCRKKRKVETCKECLWFKRNCPHLSKERKIKK